MNTRIYLLLAITLLSIVSVSAEYPGKLGDGCGGVDYSVYDASCQNVCSGEEVVQECTVIHGWCSSGNSCVPCDFRDIVTTTTIETCSDKIEPEYTSCFDGVKTQVEFSYVCEERGKSAACAPSERTVITTQLAQGETCSEKYWGFDYDGDKSYDAGPYPNIPLEYGFVPPAQEQGCTSPPGISGYCERKYWIDSSQGSPDKDSYDFFINANSKYCEDADNDLFTNECADVNAGPVKPDYQVIFSEYECNDGTPMDEYWKDSDGDGRWDDVIRACDPPSGYVTLPANANTQETNYDCNPASTQGSFPEGCYCTQDQLGKQYTRNQETFSCMKISGQTTLSKDTLISITLNRQITPQKWVKTQEQVEGILGEVSCPQGFCGISASLPQVSSDQCVPLGTIATLQGSVGEGDLICDSTSEGAAWVSRTNKLAGFLLQMGELSNQDYTLYCDSFDNIAHTYLENEGGSNPTPGSQQYIKQLTTSSSVVGSGCILVLNEGADGNYESQIAQGTRPQPFSQRVVLGFATNTIPTEIYDVDLNDRANNEEWTKTQGTYVSHPNKIVLVMQSSKDEPQTDAVLDSLFNQVATPNSFSFALFNFLRSPLSQILNVLGLQTTPQLPELIEKLYLSKSNDFYLQSVVVGEELYLKVANAPSELQAHLNENVCQKSSCLVDGSTLGLTLPASEFDIWSRPLRLQNGNTVPDYNFFDVSCTDNSECNNPPGACFESAGMCSVGFCQYNEVAPLDGDGCCPSTATEETDSDCATESTGNFACSDGADNDGDGLIDLADSGCDDATDNNEQNTQPLPISIPQTACTGTPLFYLSSQKGEANALRNTHANTQDLGNNPVVCTNIQLQTQWVSGVSCPFGYGNVITLLGYANAQVGKYTSTSTISGAQTLCAKNSNGPVECSLSTSCSESVVGLSSQTNAHVGTNYNTKLCCEYIEEGMQVQLDSLVTGTTATFTCTFEGGADPHTVVMSYGDGSTQVVQQNINTQGVQTTKTFTHTYTQGEYEATCTIRDGNLIEVEATTQVTIN